ncbi:hypothetical protein DPMN_012672 [Dreissena polymorpha]|uniref:Uncharacterized protein n=1 Tax=Dreissena polymorpha TaxID=45954 RepID=A0A9D4S3K4_DREPO|nr:hypothetical protein DPMN_012672 [Dreissena polymorpha]
MIRCTIDLQIKSTRVHAIAVVHREIVLPITPAVLTTVTAIYHDGNSFRSRFKDYVTPSHVASDSCIRCVPADAKEVSSCAVLYGVDAGEFLLTGP